MTRFGTGYVDVEPDFSNFWRSLERQLEPLNAQFATIGKDAARNLDRGVDRGLERTGRQARATGDDVGGLSKGLDGMNIALGNSAHQTKLFGSAMRVVKPAALIAGVGLLAQGLSAAAAGGIALTGALAPLSGAIIAYPAILTAASQAMGTWKLATLGLDEALEPLGEELSKPSAAAQQLVQRLTPLTGHVIALRDAAQRPIFAAIENAIPRVTRLFPILRAGISQTGVAIGGLIDRAAGLVGSKGFGRDLETQMGRNVGTITRLGNAGINLGDALRHVLIAGGPLVKWMTSLALRFSESARGAAEAGRRTGALGDFFERTRGVMSRVVSIATSLGHALFNIGKAGAPLGRELLASIDKNAKAFAAWTDSAEGKNSIVAFFERAREPIYEVGKLLRDVTKAFFTMSQGSGIAPLLKQVRTELLPVFTEVVSATTRAFGPSLVNALVQLTKLFGSMAGSSGPLVIFVDLIAQGATALNFLIGNNPALQSMLVTLAGTAAVLKAVKFAAMISGLSTVTSAVNALKTAYIAQTGAQNASLVTALRWRAAMATSAVATWAQQAATVAAGLAQRAYAAAAGVAAVAQRALNAAFLANPYVLAAAALIAIGAGLVYAYKHSETFRRIVDDSFATVKAVVLDVAAAIDGPALAAFRVIFETAKTYIGGLVQVFRGTFQVVKGIVDVFVGLVTLDFDQMGRGISGIFSGLGNIIVGQLRTMFAPVIGVVRALGSGIVSVFSSAINGVVGAVQWVFNAAKAAIDLWLTPYRIAADKIGGAIVAGFDLAKSIAGDIAGFLSNAKGKLDAWLEPFRNAAGKVAGAIVSGINGAKDIVGNVAGFIRDVLGKIADFAGNAFNKAKDLAGNIVDGVITAFTNVPKKVWEAITGWVDNLVGFVKDKLGISSPSRVFEEIGGNMMAGLIRGIDSPGEFMGVINKLFGGLPALAVQMAKKVPGKLFGFAGGLAGKAGDLFASVFSGKDGPGILTRMKDWVVGLIRHLGEIIKRMQKKGIGFGEAFGDIIPGFASGTDFYPGGLGRFGEKGPELALLSDGLGMLPRGSAVLDAERTRGLMSASTGHAADLSPSLERSDDDGEGILGTLLADIRVGDELLWPKVRGEVREANREAGEAYLAGAN